MLSTGGERRAETKVFGVGNQERYHVGLYLRKKRDVAEESDEELNGSKEPFDIECVARYVMEAKSGSRTDGKSTAMCKHAAKRLEKECNDWIMPQKT